MPQPAPIDRLITNATAYIKEHPKDAQGYYILARINYLVFINKSTQVPAFNEGKDTPPRIAANWQEGVFLNSALQDHARMLAAEEMGYASASDVPANEREKYFNLFSEKVEELRKQNWHPKGLNQDELIQHLNSAFDNFKKAIELDPKNDLYHLGLASLLEQYTDYVKEIDLKVVPEEIRNIILNRASEIYYTAYELSIKKGNIGMFQES